MADLLAARLQMAISLGFHILFAVAGMAMPALMVLAEWRYFKTGEPHYKELAHRWAKGTAILFAVGAVSGTVLSFELGLLWPTFMQHAGPLIGMPFSLEGFAFFLEAIAIGIYLYGWERVSPVMHLASGVVVAVSGLCSGVFVVAVNAWMNTPRGFSVASDGTFRDVDISEAFFTPAFPTQASHMAVAAYASVACAVLAIHAHRLLRHPDSRVHQAAARIALLVLVVAMPLQILTGDFAAKHLAEFQPAKLAAAEALFETERGAPLAIGGLPNETTRELHGAILVPKMLSVLATGDPDGEVKGLGEFPEEDWPPVPVVHVAFQVMVASGFAMLGLALWGGWLAFRRRALEKHPRFLWAAVLAGPLGLVAVEAGWVVTEVGRQPWIIQGVMRTREAITPMPNLSISLLVSVLVYAFLGLVVVLLIARYVQSSDEGAP